MHGLRGKGRRGRRAILLPPPANHHHPPVDAPSPSKKIQSHLGIECSDEEVVLANQRCSWPMQLQELLDRRYPGGRARIHLAARAATSLSWSISMIPELVPLDSDVVMVDYVQNDER